MPTLFIKIKSFIIAIIVLFSSLFSGGSVFKSDKLDPSVISTDKYCGYVNPFIGAGGIPWCSGNVSPGAAYPFGVVKLSPDSCIVNGKRPFGFGTSGYYFGNSYLLGFSHTRLSGAGVSDMGHFRVKPAIGKTDYLKCLSKPLPFSHDDEAASPGYYRVRLKVIDCTVELSSTTRVGVHRYTFGSSEDAHLLINSSSLLNKGEVKDAAVDINAGNGEITGRGTIFSSLSSRYGGLTAYYAAKFNRPFKSFSTWDDGGSKNGRTSVRGNNCGADLNFGNMKGESVELKLAISFVSIENARENLISETGELDFDSVRQSAAEAWNSYLSRIKIETDDPKIRTIFYTSLYRSMLAPAAYSDVNGEYIYFDKKVKTAEGFTFRSDMSLWDTFRTTHPLFTLIAPEIQKDSLKSLVEMAKAEGVLPRWPNATGDAACMFGTPADMVVAESYLKGIRDFDAETAYKYMKLTSDTLVAGKPCRDGVDKYNSLGYVPSDCDKSVSRTLEYSWADNSIALLARALGKENEAEKYFNKSKNYKNVFDAKTKYFRGKDAGGKWREPFSAVITTFYDEALPIKFASPYCEGSAGQWRWSVPYDPDGLISLFGSKKYFTDELDKFMKGTAKSICPLDPGAGFWLGNEHDFHAPYLFSDAGRPDLTQKWIRFVLANKFDVSANGLDGNDDFGATSSWYVWSAIGLYPVAGVDEYWIGSPNVSGAEIKLGNGKTLKITAENQSEKNVYVERVEINGITVNEPRITHSLISDGGTIRFFMSSKPVV